MQWLWYSLIASVILTVAANLAIRWWPGAGGHGPRQLDDRPAEQPTGADGQRQVRVVVPWRAMLLVSVALTVALNLAIRLV